MKVSDATLGIVREEIKRAGEPVILHAVAMRLRTRMSQEARDEVLLQALEVLAREEHAAMQARAQSATPGPSRLRRTILEERVWVGTTFKALTDCTALDLRTFAAHQERRAKYLLDKAREAKDLADQLDSSPAATLGEMWALTVAA